MNALQNFKLRNLRQRDIALAVVVLTALVGVLWYVYPYSSAQERIAELEGDISRLEVQIQRGEAARRNLPQLREAVAQLEADRRAFLAQLPRENEVAQLLDQLREAAGDAGVTFDTLQSTGARGEDVQGVRPLGFSMGTEGTYVETIDFLQTLEDLERFTKIQQVGLSVSDQDSQNPPLSASYDFTVYVFTGDDTEPVGSVNGPRAEVRR